MAARTIKRRSHQGDISERKNEHVGTAESNSLREPLLEKYDHEEKNSKNYDRRSQQDVWDDKKCECLHWTSLLSRLISQGARKIANIFISFGSLLRRLFARPLIKQNAKGDKRLPVNPSPLQEARLGTLRRRLEIPFDGSHLDHQEALKQLWRLAYPNRDVPPLKSDLWKEMGWQGPDPSKDFRGGGFISLENIIYFAKTYPDSFQRLLHKQNGKRAEWEYPFAVAGINISYMLTQMLDLNTGNPTSRAGARFVELLGEDEMAFDNLYCLAFQVLDAQWLAKRASYMEFNEVLKSTRTLIEHELALDGVYSVVDMPAYKMLNR